MKYYLLALVSILSLGTYQAQIDVSGGMGIEFTNASDVNDYLVVNRFVIAEERNTDFRTNVVFFVEACRFISEDLQLGLGYDFSVHSHNYSFPELGTYKLEYEMHKPSVMAYYVIPGKGYNFKLGGGAGIRYITVSETIPAQGSEDFSGMGFGFLLKALGNTTLGQNLYAQIGAALSFDFPGVPDNNGKAFSYNNEEQQEVNFNSFSASVRLGLSYYF